MKKYMFNALGALIISVIINVILTNNGVILIGYETPFLGAALYWLAIN